MTEWWAILLVLMSALCGGIAPIIIKVGTRKSFRKIKNIFLNPALILGIGVYALGTVFFVPALKGGELSVLYPFIATSYIWATFFSWKILKEEINRNKWYGIFFIVLGIALIGFGF
ncbi:EamA family transporter [Candidatus Woesearchaeota archaeon]|nr:EamA family transporter [Candidatus Woesearchaeota archaeon]